MDMICVMLNFRNYAEKRGKMNIINYVMIDLKDHMREIN